MPSFDLCGHTHTLTGCCGPRNAEVPQHLHRLWIWPNVPAVRLVYLAVVIGLLLSWPLSTGIYCNNFRRRDWQGCELVHGWTCSGPSRIDSQQEKEDSVPYGNEMDFANNWKPWLQVPLRSEQRGRGRGSMVKSTGCSSRKSSSRTQVWIPEPHMADHNSL